MGLLTARGWQRLAQPGCGSGLATERRRGLCLGRYMQPLLAAASSAFTRVSGWGHLPPSHPAPSPSPPPSCCCDSDPRPWRREYSRQQLLSHPPCHQPEGMGMLRMNQSSPSSAPHPNAGGDTLHPTCHACLVPEGTPHPLPGEGIPATGRDALSRGAGSKAAAFPQIPLPGFKLFRNSQQIAQTPALTAEPSRVPPLSAPAHVHGSFSQGFFL